MSYIPVHTVMSYKLFRIKKGKLYPLYVNANSEIPIGEWLEAEIGTQTSNGKVKSRIGNLALRPGWHSSDFPIAIHIGGKLPGDKLPTYRPDNQVWARVEMSADIDWQEEANRRALKRKDGTIISKTACITDQVPYHGYYRYKTNPNMIGTWLISGNMKVICVLNDSEVLSINSQAGLSDLPRLHNL